MIHLLAVLPGAALVLVAALRVVSGKDLGQGGVSTTHMRFILAGLLLISSPGTMPLLASALSGLAGPSWHGAGLTTAAAVVAAAVAVLLPHDPDDYRQLIYGTRPVELEAR